VLARLHLVRHGEVHNPRHLAYASLPGFGLNERGRTEASAVAAHLAREHIDVVVSSPLERAVATAGPIAAAAGAPHRGDDRLIEWRLADRWAGTVWEDLADRFPGELEAYLDHPHDLPFSPESIDEVAVRMAAVVDELGEEYPDGTAVVVSHQDPVQALRLRLTGRPMQNLRFDKPDHCTVITLEPAWTEADRWDPPPTTG
jgi:broad specificity phosphatase PhoE